MMQTTKLAQLSNRFRTLLTQARRQTKPHRLLRQFLVATLIAALVLVSLPMSKRLTPPAQAQITILPPRICDPSNPGAASQIIQKCALGDAGEYTLENSVINELLSTHKLPQSDRSRLLGWERDLIRAAMYAKLITDIQNGSTQAPMPTLAALVKARRVLAATKALDEYHRWAANCPYIAPGPFFTYAETQCTGLAGLFGRNAPSFEEFQAYGAFLANADLQNNAAMQESAKNMALGMGLLSGLVATGVTTGILAGLSVSIPAITGALFPSAGVAGAAIPSLIGVGAVAAPIAVICFAVVIATIRGLQVAGQDQIPGKLQEAKTAAINETINLAQLITTDNGKREIYNEFLQASFPDFPATTGVPTPNGLDPQFENKPSGGSFTATPSLQYKDWDGNAHTLRLDGGWFVDRKGSEAERLALSVKLLNGSGGKRQVSRIGSQFLVTDVSGNGATSVKSLEFDYRDANGNPYVARLLSAPPTIITFNVTRRQESPAATTDFLGNPTTTNVEQIATIADAQDAVEGLTLTPPSALTNNGITLSEITVQPDGKVMARVQPSCSATDAAFAFEVTDTAGTTVSATLNVTVTPNAAPVLSYAASHNVTVGGTLTVMPTEGPSDDTGQLNALPATLVVGTPTITPITINPGAPPFTGTVTHLTVLANILYLFPSGPLEIKNAGPIGSYRVNVPLTDSCGLTTTGTFILNVVCAPPTLTYSATNPACSGAHNGQITLNATGGTNPLLYSIDNGQHYQSNNVFTGLAAGDYFVSVKDSIACAAATQQVTLTDPSPVTFTTTSANPTCNGASNGQITINASGGTGTLQFSKDNGASFQTGNVSGNLGGSYQTKVFSDLAAGTYQIKVKDANGCAAAVQTVTLTQPTAITVAAITVPNSTVGVGYPATTFTSSGGTGNRTLSLTGTLPQGMQFVGGVLSGTPQQTGSFPFSVTATDQNNCTASRNFTLTINCPTITLAPTTLFAGKFGTPYSQTITPSGGAAPYTFNVTGLPAGLTANPTTTSVTLHGIPRQAGSFTVTVTATDVYGCQGSRTYTLNLGVPGDMRFSSDYDGDGKADLAIWRPSTATFWVSASATTSTLTRQLGSPTDIPVPGDYDGDGKTDYAVWRPATATFTIINSSNGATVTGQWGNSTDLPVPGDYDGDGKTDYAIWRPATGVWWILRSSNGSTMTAQLGSLGDVPLPNDHDGDGKTDLVIWRPATATFWIYQSAMSSTITKQVGSATDLAVSGDYDGDGKVDCAVWRPATATFTVIQSTNGATVNGQWGNSTDLPVPGDYDGDSKADYAVWRQATASWIALRSSTGTMMSTPWGAAGDLPVR